MSLATGETPPQFIPPNYDRLLNPEGLLPKLTIQEIPTRAKGTFVPRSFVATGSDGRLIGNFTLNISTPPKRDKTAYLNTIKVVDDERGKGYGKATYLEILKYLQGIKLTSGFQLTADSKRMWDWLVEKGVARKIKEGTMNDMGHDSSEYETI